MSILSETLYFLEDEAIERFAITLIRRNVAELVEVAVISETDEGGWLTLRMTTVAGEVYYREVNQEGSWSTLFTAEQWELQSVHIEFFEGKIEVPMAAASILAEASIPEIVDYEVIEDFDVEIFSLDSIFLHNPMVLFLRIEVASREVYYLGFDESGYLQVVRRNGIDGEDLYSPHKPGWIHLAE